MPERTDGHDHDFTGGDELRLRGQIVRTIDDIDWRLLVDSVPQIDLAVEMR